MVRNYHKEYKELLKPVNMLNLYAKGAFPMADDNGIINWYLPEVRTVIKLDDFNIPRSLRKFMEHCNFEYRFDENILSVIENCANRNPTWISQELIKAYQRLIKLSYLHSVEVFQSDMLVGGLYGISIGGVFFGESMFSKVSQASKSALVTLIKHLRTKDFVFIDVQFQTPHLKMFGTKEIPLKEYNNLLDIAYKKNVSFI